MIGLGTVWILDGLEVTIVGAIAPRLTEAGSGIDLTSADIGTAAALLRRRRLSRRAVLRPAHRPLRAQEALHGRRSLLYLVATVATAFAFAPWYFFLFRFLTGFGIGGEYAAINSAIDELIPARNRGQVDLAINGSFWVGSAIGGLAALLLLDASIFAARPRLAAGVRRRRDPGPGDPDRPPPRPGEPALAVHPRPGGGGRAHRRPDRGGGARARPARSCPSRATRSRSASATSIPFRELAGRSLSSATRAARSSASALFIGQAFLYNAVTSSTSARSCTTSSTSRSSHVPYLFVLFALSNFLGPLLLGRLFDTVGRIPMIAGHLPRSRLRSSPLLGVLLSAVARRVLVHGAGRRRVLPRLRGRELRLPDRQRDLPDGDPRARDRAASTRSARPSGGIAGPLLFGAAHPQRRRRPGGDRLLHRRRRDGARRHRGAASSACAPSSSRSRTSRGR